MRMTARLLLPLALCSAPAIAANMIVVDARGAGLKPGMTVNSASVIDLKEGERVTMISADGRSVMLRGAYHGPAVRGSTSAQDPRAALAALISTRNDRAKTVGAIRAGANAVALPDPWLVDITRPGVRCVREGEEPVWWRPDARTAEPFKVFPIDRSWRADFQWRAGTASMPAPALSKLEGASTYIVQVEGQENAITISVIPRGITEPLMLSAWMLERTCIQQADAYLRKIEADLSRRPVDAAAPMPEERRAAALALKGASPL